MTYNRRCRIGLIVPSSNTTMEPEFARYAPQDVSVHTTRLRLEEVSEAELERMAEGVEEAAMLLADAGVEIIAYGCTTGSLIKGRGYEKELEERIKKAVGIPAITTARAVLDALRERGLRKIAVFTPYTERINEKERDFLIDSGFEVCAIRSLGLTRNLEIGMQEPRVAYKLGSELMRQQPEADGLFISCTNFRTFEIISSLSQRVGRPVITSNQATLLCALREIGVPPPQQLTA